MSTNQKSHQKNQTQKKAAINKTKQRTKQPLNQQQMLEAPETMHSEEVLAAQQEFGNQVVQRAFNKKQRRQSLTDEQGYLRSEISNVIQQKRGGGSSLPDNVQKDVSQRFKHDFRDVRLHTDDEADKLSRAINARAFTIGKDIFFKRGVFASGSSQGRETLLHELTHVVQQSGTKGFSGRLKLGDTDSAHEKQAKRIGQQYSAAESVKQGAAAPGVGVQTLGEEEELQMQELEEEELQTQELEEEELQMEPDIAGVIQRVENEDEDIFDKDNKLNYKAYSKQALGGGKVAPGIQEQVKKFGGSKWDKPESSGPQKKVKSSQKLIPKKKIEEKNIIEPKKVSAKLEPKVPENPRQIKEKSNVEDKENDKPLPSPLPKREDKKDDKAPLSFSDEIKAKSKEMKTNKQRQNLEKLEADRGKKVGERVSEQYLEEKKPSFLSRVGSFAKKAGGVAKKWGGRFFGSALDTARDQVFGKEEAKEEPKAPSPSPVTVNVGGGGGNGSGGLDMLAKYIKENEQLKTKIAELEKEKK